MVLSLGGRNQIGDVVVAETLSQAQWARLGSVGLRRGRSENLLQANAQCGVDHLFEGLVKPGRALLALAAISGSSVNVVLVHTS